MADNKYLKLAREARAENNTEDALRYYEKVRDEDPENGEAKFFHAFYKLYEGKNGELVGRFVDLCHAIEPAIKKIAKSEDPGVEKLAALTAIIDEFVPETWDLHAYLVNLTVGSGSDRQEVIPQSQRIIAERTGMATLYKTGDLIEDLFGADPEAMKLAVKCWKEGVALQRKWYSMGQKGDPEKYSQKIQRFEPSYSMPKKACCISFANSRPKQ